MDSQFYVEIENIPIPEKKNISFHLSNGQLWYLHFDADTTKSLWLNSLYSNLNKPIQSIKNISRVHPENLFYHTSDLIEIAKYQIRTNEFATFYYQQRYQAFEDNEDSITLQNFLNNNTSKKFHLVTHSLEINHLLNQPTHKLSTGEFKKACIAKFLLSEKPILIFDEPFAGLDLHNQSMVLKTFQKLLNQHCIVILSTLYFTLEIEHQYFKVGNISPKNNKIDTNEVLNNQIANIFKTHVPKKFNICFKLKNLNVKYYNSVILQDISWEIKRNEKWALIGKNGSGKSTLLSILYADHPQAYANEIIRFDSTVGYGITIWNIKENIGFYSHEMYRFFDKTLSIIDTLKTIIFVNPYKNNQLSPEIINQIKTLFQHFGIYYDLTQPLHKLNDFEQKVIILCGVLLKNTDVYIFDEPYQGFDQNLILKFNFIIDNFLNDRTIIFVSHNENDYPTCITQKFVLNGNFK